MHNLDRTQTEVFEFETDEFETDEFETDEFEMDEFETDEYNSVGETTSIFSEADEMELAAELLEVTDEAELDQFLGGLIRRARKLAGGVFKGPIGRALKGVIKQVVQKGMPMLGGALGSLVAPGIGTAVGSSLGSTASSLFGLELEGMSDEDQEFEVARQIVRLGGEAVRQATTIPPGTNPQVVANQALRAAAQQHAPGLVSRTNGTKRNDVARKPTRGVWTRHGNKVILHGL